jgi:enoyl-CoA hydratase
LSTIDLSVREAVATIVLNRPEARNAVNLAMCEELLAAARSIAADATLRVVFVRGAGPVFCAGADLKERTGKTKEWIRERRVKAFAAYQAVEALPMPVIALVHGPALGAAIEISSVCDFIIATPDATFGTPEAIRGTVGATQRLPRVIGKRLAKDLMFTGRRLSAAEAMLAGFVSRVVESAELENVMAEIAKTILAAPPLAIRLAKRCIDRGVELDPQGALAVELEAIDEQLASGSWLGKQ